MSYLLRRESPEDLQALALLLVAVDASWGTVPFGVAVREGGVEAAQGVIDKPRLYSLVAEDDGATIVYGALQVKPEALWLTNVFVAPDRQGEGIGRAIVDALCQRAQGHGGDIHLDVLLDSIASLRLYESASFKPIGVTNGRLSGREGRLMCLEMDTLGSCLPLEL